ncbi:carbohydrate ABC transporter substrate-binding protein, CUT1 family [Alkalispirochaeta americana]|uniref:Carbohydrate ABC transporter substrate-binding protein, CUT1 family n=1 Tax=Alkalispirochaeta americana TaxID=159291 RepID=A0A1N6TV74_9SPIO|nr:extracellular solute-binding protein [Alkalispirochaeta americana]SIQ57243.1 carbohydrate ABC transporter substrate-binding protein, CUT1 family [Alkalispirochaeta americana]
MRRCRTLMVLVLATLIAGVAFGGGQKEDQSRRLVINSNLSDPAPRAAFAEVVEQFREENPDLDVVVNTFDHEAYKTAIRNFLVADPPDVALWFAGERMKYFVDQGLLEDISDVWAENDLHRAMASSRLAATVDGRQYGVPWGYYQWGVYYRKDIFAEHGLEVPETWDEFIALGEVLKNQGITPVTIGTRYLWTTAGWFDYLNLRINGYDYHMRLMAGEASYLDSELDRVFEVWQDLVDREFFLANHATYSWQEAQAPLINGTAAMYLIGNFIIPDMEAAGVGDKMGFFQFPVIDPSVGIYEDAPTETYHIPAGARNKEGARRFLAFASRPDVLAQFAAATGNISPHRDSPPPRDPFVLKGFEMLNAADGLAQFYDRDTSEEMARHGMEGFQEFMVNPDRLERILQRLDRRREEIFSR